MGGEDHPIPLYSFHLLSHCLYWPQFVWYHPYTPSTTVLRGILWLFENFSRNVWLSGLHKSQVCLPITATSVTDHCSASSRIHGYQSSLSSLSSLQLELPPSLTTSRLSLLNFLILLMKQTSYKVTASFQCLYVTLFEPYHQDTEDSLHSYLASFAQ